MYNLCFSVPADCSVKFTDALYWEQEHNIAGIGVPDFTARLVWVWIGAVVSLNFFYCILVLFIFRICLYLKYFNVSLSQI